MNLAIRLAVPLIAALGCHETTRVNSPGPHFDAVPTVTDYDAIVLAIPGSNIIPRAIDDHGVVHGTYRDDQFVTHVFRWDDGVVTDLGTMPSTLHVLRAMSPSGLGAGFIRACDGCDHARAAFLFENGAVTELPVGGSGEVIIHEITDAGDVIAIVRSSAVIWIDGVMQDLGSLDPVNPQVQPLGINRHQLVVGSTGATGHRYYRGFLWDDGTMTALALIGGDQPCPDDPRQLCSRNFAEDINDHGDVVGFSTDADLVEQPVIWRRGGAAEDLGIPNAYPFFINNRRQVLLGAFPNWYFWDAGSVQTIGTLGGSFRVVRGFNDRGEVTGTSSLADGSAHAYLWRDGHMIDLGTAPGAQTSEGLFLNERGDVLGVWYTPEGDQRAMVWLRR